MRELKALLRKDLTTELRDKGDLIVKLSFAVAAGVVASAAAAYAEEPAMAVAGALIIFTVMTGLFEAYSSFIREALTGTLDGLRAAPVEGWLLLASKALVSSLWVWLELIIFAATAAIFTLGLNPSWPPLLAWTVGEAVFMGGISSFVSASLSYGEARAGGVALLVLSLSIPFLRVSVDPLIVSLSGTYPSPGGLASMSIAALGFTAFTVVLGGLTLE
ncbi:MAG: ABC transporter permease [Desulfurococcales archaeon]|nr:ABC transporter permease [Desulfurococcales archaeon]